MILLILLLVALATVFGLYRHEVTLLTRQLEFLSRHESNMELRASLRLRELRTLQEVLNRLIVEQKRLREDYLIKDMDFKETLANISHDIRTPLTSLSGYFQLLERSQDPKKIQHYHQVIKARIEELKDLLENSFAYLKLADERELSSLIALDVTMPLCAAIESFRPAIAARGLNLKSEIGGPLLCRAREEALQRIFNNLLSNCLAYAKSSVWIAARPESQHLVFVFQNDYFPWQKPDVEKVFQRYYRFDRARSARSSGLGLTIVKQLTEKLGGQVRAELSETRFQIELILPRLQQDSRDCC